MTTNQVIKQIGQVTSKKITQNLLIWVSVVFLVALIAVLIPGQFHINRQDINALGLLVASGAYASPENSRLRLLVQYAPGQRANVERALSASAAEFHYAFEALDTFAVTIPAAAYDGLSRNPGVVFIEEDARRYPIAITRSKSPAQGPVEAMALPDQVVPYGLDMVQARDVWDANRDGNVDAGAPTGAGRKICIIDSGFYTGHEDLPSNQAQVTGYNGSLPWNQDGFGHGTHVAGTIVAMNNALGVIGVTPGTVSIYVVRVFGDDGAWAYSSTLIDAANRCASAGANIISMSLGGNIPNRTEENGFASLYNQGILSIAAAGNDGNSRNSYPASYDSVISVAAIDSNEVVASFSQYNSQVELAAPGVGVLSTVPYLDSTTLTVGGVTYSGGHIEFSARGSASGELVDGGLCTATNNAWSGKVVLCERGTISFYDKVINVQNSGGAAAAIYNNAPGNFLGTLGAGNSSTKIAISLSQEDGQYLVTNRLGQSATVNSTYTAPDSGYEYYDGTSMATPHVSAVAALVWSSKPSATNAEIRQVLQQTAKDLGATGRDANYGFGLVQAKAAIDALNLIITATPTGTATFTATATNTGTATPTGTATFTATATNTATATPTGTVTFTATATNTATATPTGTATFTATPTSTTTSTVTLTPVPDNDPFKVYLPIVLNGNATNQPAGDVIVTNREKSFGASLVSSIQTLWQLLFPGPP